MRLLRVFLVTRHRLRRASAQPTLVMLGYHLGRGLRVEKRALPLRRALFCRGLSGAGLLYFPRFFDALHLAPQSPRGTAREIRRGKLAVREPLLFLGRRRGERAFEIALAPFRELGFVARRLDVSQRIRESAHLVVDVLFADSPERVERVFSRHDAFDTSAGRRS